MKYVFVIPDFIAQFYFCSHTGEGFTLTTRIEDALTSSDAESAVMEIERLKRQSGHLVQARKVLM